MQVFFYECFKEEETLIRQLLPPSIEAGFSRDTISESGHITPPARIISIRTQSRIPESWNLDAILSRSTGYDHIQDLTGTPCGYLPIYCNRAVAEQAILLIMSLLRKLPRQISQFSSFDRDDLTGSECRGKTLLVAGVGNIGYEIALMGEGLGMEVLGTDIVRRHSAINYIDISEGLGKADVVVCAMNLTKENRGFFNYERLIRAKRGLVFVNISRGELSPSYDLLRLLDEGRISGVALDVYEDEDCLAEGLRKKSTDDRVELELKKRDNVILTPHNAFNTTEALEIKTSQSVRQILHFIEHRNFIWTVPGEK